MASLKISRLWLLLSLATIASADTPAPVSSPAAQYKLLEKSTLSVSAIAGALNAKSVPAEAAKARELATLVRQLKGYSAAGQDRGSPFVEAVSIRLDELAVLSSSADASTVGREIEGLNTAIKFQLDTRAGKMGMNKLNFDWASLKIKTTKAGQAVGGYQVFANPALIGLRDPAFYVAPNNTQNGKPALLTVECGRILIWARKGQIVVGKREARILPGQSTEDLELEVDQ